MYPKVFMVANPPSTTLIQHGIIKYIYVKYYIPKIVILKYTF